MASPYNITRIPAPRVPFLDERTGQISREWYRFLLNLFVLTGSGTNPTTLDELQLGPPPLTIDEINTIIANSSGDLALNIRICQVCTLTCIHKLSWLQCHLYSLVPWRYQS